MSNKRPNYVDNERYRRHLAKQDRTFMPDIPATRQAIYERFLTKRLMEIASSRFQWHGLPPSVDSRFLEMTLLREGLAIFFEDTKNTGELFVLRGSPQGHFNPTDNPTRFNVYGNNFPTASMSSRDCVPIWANYSRTPDMDIINIYAHRLATVDVTLDVNGANARRTRVALATENQRLSVANVNRQIDEGNPVVYLDGEGPNLAGGNITTVDLGVEPRTIEQLHIYRVRLWNEAMMMLGVQGANQDKKERLVASEVDANSEQVLLSRETALNARRIACEQINRKYAARGVKVSVDFVDLGGLPLPADGA